MATILNNAPYMGFPLSIKRGNPAPVDTTAVWYDKTELETYATSGATAYVGQILTLVADSKCEAYMISNEAGTLIKLASTTASGDLASDVATLQGQVADLIAAVGKKAAGEEPATGIYKDIADAVALANSKVASVKAADKSITVEGTATAPTVKVTLSADEGNALILADDGLKVTIPDVKVPEYSIVTESSDDYAAVYRLTKDNVKVGAAINIPKDMVVQSGTVETFYEGALPAGVTEPGTYIVLILANSGSKPLYIPVSSLVDVYTGTPTEDAKTAAVLVNVDPTSHVITASIREGSIAKAMLSSDIQASLSKADSAIQEITTGSVNGNISVDGTDVPVKGLADAAYTTVASLNTTAKGYADNVQTALIGKDTDEKTADTIKGAKQYAGEAAASAKSGAEATAKGYVNALDVADTAVATQLVSAVSQTDGKISVTRRALVAADIPELTQSKISGLETALAGKQDTVTFDGVYSADNKAATVSTVTTAKKALIGNVNDGASDNTIIGIKNYTNEAITGLNLALSKNISALEDTHATKTDGSFKTVAEEVTAGITNLDLSNTYAAKSLETTVSDHIADTTVHITADERTKWDKASTQAEANKAAIATINGDGEGSIKKAVADAKTELNTEIGKKADDFSDKASFTSDGLKFTTVPTAILDAGTTGIEYSAGAEGRDYAAITPVNVAKGIFLENFKVKDAKITSDESIVNKKYVTDTVATATAGLTGAMHFKGKLDALPTAADYDAGDVVIVGQKEYVLLDDAGTKSWSLLGDEGSYAVKGSITNADIATNAAIAQSKISGLTNALAAKLDATTAASTYVAKENGKSLVDDVEIARLLNMETGAQANKIESIKAGGTALTIAADKSVNIPAATASAFGVIKVDNTSIKATDGVIAIKAVSTDLLTQGTETLILNCGGAAD